MRNPWWRIGVLVLCIGWVSGLGCRSTTQRGTTTQGTATTTAETKPSTQAPPEEERNIEEIRYEITGGIAGLQLRLDIDSSGNALVYDRERLTRGGRIEAPEWQELKTLVEAADLTELKASYGRTGDVADAISEILTINRDGRTVQISLVTDPSDQPPERLHALTRRLMELTHTLPARDEEQ